MVSGVGSPQVILPNFGFSDQAGGIQFQSEVGGVGLEAGGGSIEDQFWGAGQPQQGDDGYIPPAMQVPQNAPQTEIVKILANYSTEQLTKYIKDQYKKNNDGEEPSDDYVQKKISYWYQQFQGGGYTTTGISASQKQYDITVAKLKGVLPHVPDYIKNQCKTSAGKMDWGKMLGLLQQDDPNLYNLVQSQITLAVKNQGLTLPTPMHPPASMLGGGSPPGGAGYYQPGGGVNQVPAPSGADEELQRASDLIYSKSGDQVENCKKALKMIKAAMNSGAISGAQAKQYADYLAATAALYSGNTADAEKYTAAYTTDGGSTSGGLGNAMKQVGDGVEQAKKNGEDNAAYTDAYEAYNRGIKLYQQAIAADSTDVKQAQALFLQAYQQFKQAKGNAAFAGKVPSLGYMIGESLRYGGTSDAQKKQANDILSEFASKNAGTTDSNLSDNVKQAQGQVTWANNQQAASDAFSKIYNDTLFRENHPREAAQELAALAKKYPGLEKNWPAYTYLVAQSLWQAGMYDQARTWMGKTNKMIASGQLTGSMISPDMSNADLKAGMTTMDSQLNGGFLSNPQLWWTNAFGGNEVMGVVFKGIANPWVSTEGLTRVSQNITQSVMGKRGKKGAFSVRAGFDMKKFLTGKDAEKLFGKDALSHFEHASYNDQQKMEEYEQRFSESVATIRECEKKLGGHSVWDDAKSVLPWNESLEDNPVERQRLESKLREAKSEMKHLQEKVKETNKEVKASEGVPEGMSDAEKAGHDYYKGRVSMLEQFKGAEGADVPSAMFRLPSGQTAAGASAEKMSADELDKAHEQAVTDLQDYEEKMKTQGEEKAKAKAEAVEGYVKHVETDLAAAKNVTDALEKQLTAEKDNPEMSEKVEGDPDGRTNREKIDDVISKVHSMTKDLEGEKERLDMQKKAIEGAENGWWGLGQTKTQASTGFAAQAGGTEEKPLYSASGADGQASANAQVMAGGARARTFQMSFASSMTNFMMQTGAQAQAIAAYGEASVSGATGKVNIDGQSENMFSGNASVDGGILAQGDAAYDLAMGSDNNVSASLGGFAGAMAQGVAGGSVAGVGIVAMGGVGLGIGLHAHAGIELEHGVLKANLDFSIGLGPAFSFQFNPTFNFNQIAVELKGCLQDVGMYGTVDTLASGAMSEFKKGEIFGGAALGLAAAATTATAGVVGGFVAAGKEIGSWFD